MAEAKVELSARALAALARFRSEVKAMHAASTEAGERIHRQEARSASFELAHEISRLEHEANPPPPPDRRHMLTCRCARCIAGG